MTASHFTPRLSLPYPDESDPADVPLDIHNLATALDTVTARTPGQAASAVPILDVGVAGQIRAGRQLALADFTALGLSAPAALWNLSDLNDASGGNRLLVNKGAVPFGPGINGLASTAAVFAGSTTQGLYIADTGAADSLRIGTGSWGCWFRTAKRGTNQDLVTKRGASAGQLSYMLSINAGSNVAQTVVSSDGTALVLALGVTDLGDDRWHFAVSTYDGTVARLYVDGVLEATATGSGPIFAGSWPLNLGSYAADASTVAAEPHYGRIDEAFVTADVLTPDQVRVLYCAKLAHGFAVTPTAVTVNVRRRRKGAAFAVTDFPTQPLRLHNFTGGALTDQGSNNQTLVNFGGYNIVAGADGSAAGANNFLAAGGYNHAATDAGLPAGTAARSYGCWVKTTSATGIVNVMAWGQTPGANDSRLVNNAGNIISYSGTDSIGGTFFADGQWHHVVVTEDNAAGDGVKRKLYLDGRLISGSTLMVATVLGGSNFFRVGANSTGGGPFNGQIDGVFVCGYALTQDQISTLYAKGSAALAPSPKNAGDHVEHMDATNVYATFDTLDSQHQIDLAVTG